MGLLTRVRERFGRGGSSGTAHLHGRTERRDAETRPTDGASRTCPSCDGVMVFREAYRIMRVERNTMEPGWVCHTHPCGYREFLRR
jgi:hypothetical protein